jgi:galactose-1-phosphate uridylyltransferase
MPEFVVERKAMTFLDPVTGAPVTRGAEIRVDPLTGDTVRVFDFPFRIPPHPDLDALGRATRESCPFCPGRLEQATPRFLDELLPGGRMWEGAMVVVPNYLPYDLVCAVAILGPEHLVRLTEMEAPWIAAGFTLAQRFQRTIAARLPAAGHRSLNWNFMPPSGGSLVHPHLQLVAGDRPYRFSAALADAARAYRVRTGRDYWPDLLAEERRLTERVIGTTGRWTWLTAFAPRSRFFEVLAVHETASSFERLPAADLVTLGEGLVRILAYFDSLAFWAFNLVILGREEPGDEGFRVQLRITPRLTILPAGMSDISFVLYQGEFLAFYRPETIASAIRPRFAPGATGFVSDTRAAAHEPRRRSS